MKKTECAGCLYSDVADANKRYFKCRLNPPAYVGGVGNLATAEMSGLINQLQCTVFPIVRATDWCGKWAAQ